MQRRADHAGVILQGGRYNPRFSRQGMQQRILHHQFGNGAHQAVALRRHSAADAQHLRLQQRDNIRYPHRKAGDKGIKHPLRRGIPLIHCRKHGIAVYAT